MLRLALLAGLVGLVQAAHFKEVFDSEWAARWKPSSFKANEGTRGEFSHTAGKFFADEEASKGIQTGPDARFFTLYSEMDSTFSNEDKPLVLQFSVKHEQQIDCGGGYIKLIPESSADQMPDFGGATPYSIMFGPDICGFGTKRIHVIFTHNEVNHLVNKDIPCETDQLTHVYTLVVNPDKTYQVLVDLKERAAGSLYDDWGMIEPRKIKDPDAVKPEDWDDRSMIADPDAEKPDDWDEQPEQIADPEASKPADWDDEEDGEWEPPVIPNPDYKGEWHAPMIPNPDYQGKWEAPEIDNPKFVDDPSIGVYTDLKFLGFELWQVKAGTIFDNIMLTDSLEEAKEFAEATWGAGKEVEKAKLEELKAAEADAAAAAAAEMEDEYDEYADYDDAAYLPEEEDEYIDEEDEEEAIGHDEL